MQREEGENDRTVEEEEEDQCTSGNCPLSTVSAVDTLIRLIRRCT